MNCPSFATVQRGPLRSYPVSPAVAALLAARRARLDYLYAWGLL